METNYYMLYCPSGLINKDLYTTKNQEDYGYLSTLYKGQIEFDENKVLIVIQKNSNKESRDYTIPLKPLEIIPIPSNQFFSFLDSLNLSHLYYKVPIQMIEKGTKRIVEEYTGILVPKQRTSMTKIENTDNYYLDNQKVKAEVKDDRIFIVGQGSICVRNDIKELIEKKFPNGCRWRDATALT